MVSHIVALVIFFLISWIISSVPIWLAAKFFSKHSSFGSAMLATLGALIIFTIISFIFSVIGIAILGLLLGFIGILFVFKSVFDVGWLGALGIAILAFIISIIIGVILAAIGITIPLFLHL